MVKQVWNWSGFEEENQGAEEGEREEQEEAEVGEQAGPDGGGGDVRQCGVGNIFQEGQIFTNIM